MPAIDAEAVRAQNPTLAVTVLEGAFEARVLPPTHGTVDRVTRIMTTAWSTI
jgi:hypothetical protein